MVNYTGLYYLVRGVKVSKGRFTRGGDKQKKPGSIPERKTQKKLVAVGLKAKI